MYRRFGTAARGLSILALVLALADAATQVIRYFQFSDAALAVFAAWAVFGGVLLAIARQLRNPCLGQSLAAGILGTTLILIEATIDILNPEADFGFHFEELLLASGGLNMLMEEARLSEEYQELLARRAEAKDQADRIIKDVEQFRGVILTAAQKAFGAKKSDKAATRIEGR